MQQRAKYKDKDYFTQKIKQFYELYAEHKAFYENLVKERGYKYEGHELMEHHLSNVKQMIFATKYSRGDSVATLLEEGQETFMHFVYSWEVGDFMYNQVLNAISIGILMEADQFYFEQIASMMKQDKFEDYVISYLLAYKVPTHPVSTRFCFPKDQNLQRIKEITQLPKLQAQASLKQYLEQDWYTKKNLEEDYNAHKRNDNSYIGYWSFESGAITKIMGLDDNSFKNNEYYPYDLVHWKQVQA